MRKRGYYILLLTATIMIAGCNNNSSEPTTEASNNSATSDTPAQNTEEVATEETATTIDPLAAPVPVTVVVQQEDASTAPITEVKDIAQSSSPKQITELIESGAVTLDDTGNFNPKQPITRAEFINWMYGYDNKHVKTKNPATPSYSDVAPNHPDYRIIEGLQAAGIITGFPDGTMKLDKELSRQELTLLWGWYQRENDVIDPIGGESTQQFTLNEYSDMKKIGKTYLASLSYYGGDKEQPYAKVFATNKTLNPQEAVTREQAAKWIVDYKNIDERQAEIDKENLSDPTIENSPTSSATTITINDISKSHVKRQIVQLVQSGAVAVDTNGQFRPDDSITRRDFLKWLYKYDFKDFEPVQSNQSSFEDVAVDDPDHLLIETLKKADAIVPLDNNELRLDEPLTREQLTLIWSWYQDQFSVKDPIINVDVLRTNLNNSIGEDAKDIGKPYQNKDLYVHGIAGYLTGDREYRNVFGFVKLIHPQAEVSRAEAAQWLVDYTEKEE